MIDINHNMTNHPPATEATVERIETLRRVFKSAGHQIQASCPESREQSLALTHLEQSLMWAVAAIARNQ